MGICKYFFPGLLFIPHFMPLFLFWMFNLLALFVLAFWANNLLNTAFYLLSSTGDTPFIADMIFWRAFFRFMTGLFFVILYFLPLRFGSARSLAEKKGQFLMNGEP